MSRVLLAAFASLLISCQFSENRYAKHHISADQLVGTWSITDASLKDLRDAGVRQHLSKQENVLVLRRDHSCTLSTFLRPDAVWPSGDPAYSAYETGCTWQLGNFGHESLDLTLPHSAPIQPYYYFDERGGKLLIWQFVGDPDQWQYLEFEKAQPNSG